MSVRGDQLDSGSVVGGYRIDELISRGGMGVVYRATNVDDRQFAGMGLGLFICRAIAEQHGGTITVDSRQGEGTTFHVALPTIGIEEKQDG